MQLQKASLCRYSELALIYLPLSPMSDLENGNPEDLETADTAVAVAEAPEEALELDTDTSDFVEGLLEAAE